MSRSFKKVAVGAVTTARSEKADKQAEHTKQRAALRQRMGRGEYDSARWDVRSGGFFSKDGKVRLVGTDYEAKALRK